MPKVASSPRLPKDLLEQIYAEVETRVSKKFESRIRELEKKCEKAERERDAWRTRYFKEQEKSRQLEGQLQLARAEIKSLKEVVSKQAAQIEALQNQIHGKKSEVSQPEPRKPVPKRGRGKQPGSPGCGRKKRDSIEPVHCTHDIEDAERNCAKCGLPYEDMSEKVSEQIHVEHKVIRIVHHRKVVRKTCTCAGVPTIKVAKRPPQLFKGSIFTIDTWSHVIFDKYHLQRPLNRVRESLELLGLKVSQGTLTNGLKRLHKNQVFKPIIDEIQKKVAGSNKQQKDETGWKVFQEVDGKKSYSWWLWVTRTDDCCLFDIDPSRSRKVAKRTIGDDPVVLVSDCLSVYHNMGDNVQNAWCWAHIRRALLALKRLGKSWVSKVDTLYHLNNLRLSAATPEQFNIYDQQLRAAISEFERQAKRNASRVGMSEDATKVFKRIADHWDGLTVFVRMPAIPMDNNLSEQALRNGVVGRKCYYGSGSQWSAELTADLFSIFETLKMNGINCRAWLLEYLYAVGRNDCKPPSNAAAFLPWNAPPLEHLHS